MSASAAGKPNMSLFISLRTAITHVSHILAKLDLDTRSAAAAQAVRE